MNVTIEDITEEDNHKYREHQTRTNAKVVEVEEEQNQNQQLKGRKTIFQHIQKKIDGFRKIYTATDEKRVEKDFMYMMLSGKKDYDRQSFLVTLIDTLKQTYVETETEKGLDSSEKIILDKLLSCRDPDLQDALWFFSMTVMSSLKDWIIHGDPKKGMAAPSIGNHNMFGYFTRSSAFEGMCEDLLNGGFDVSGFAIAMRSEYGMTVGFTDMSKVMDDVIKQHTTI